MRIILLVILLCTQAALADPLPPGKPAGVHQAVAHGDEILIMGACGAAAVLAAVLLIGGGKSSSASATSP